MANCWIAQAWTMSCRLAMWSDVLSWDVTCTHVCHASALIDCCSGSSAPAANSRAQARGCCMAHWPPLSPCIPKIRCRGGMRLGLASQVGHHAAHRFQTHGRRSSNRLLGALAGLVRGGLPLTGCRRERTGCRLLLGTVGQAAQLHSDAHSFHSLHDNTCNEISHVALRDMKGFQGRNVTAAILARLANRQTYHIHSMTSSCVVRA